MQSRSGKDCFGLDQAQVRPYTAIARHTVLVTSGAVIVGPVSSAAATLVSADDSHQVQDCRSGDLIT